MKMKKFINNPENLTLKLLEGFAEARKELVTPDENRMVVNNRLTGANRVTIVTQGDSGHEPAISEFMEEGVTGISVVGGVLAVPGSQACLNVIKLTDKGKGVLYVVSNHADDMFTGNLTMKKCVEEGLNVVKVVIQEDIANTLRSSVDDREGLMGCISTYRIAGATAVEGKSLEEVAAIAQQFADNMATLAVTVSGATHPITGSPLVDLGEDEMEIDMGQHGEGGDGRQTMKSTDETAKVMPDGLLVDLDTGEDKKIVLIFNGTDTTTLMEPFTICRRYVSYLKGKNIEIMVNCVGKFLTAQEQAGFQMFMARMGNGFLYYRNAPCNMPYMKK